MRQQVPNAVTEGSPAPRGRETVPAIHNEAPTSVGRGGAGNFRSPSKEPGKFFSSQFLNAVVYVPAMGRDAFRILHFSPHRDHIVQQWQSSVVEGWMYAFRMDSADDVIEVHFMIAKSSYSIFFFVFSHVNTFLPILTYTIELAFYRTW